MTRKHGGRKYLRRYEANLTLPGGTDDKKDKSKLVFCAQFSGSLPVPLI